MMRLYRLYLCFAHGSFLNVVLFHSTFTEERVFLSQPLSPVWVRHGSLWAAVGPLWWASKHQCLQALDPLWCEWGAVDAVWCGRWWEREHVVWTHHLLFVLRFAVFCREQIVWIFVDRRSVYRRKNGQSRLSDEFGANLWSARIVYNGVANFKFIHLIHQQQNA